MKKFNKVKNYLVYAKCWVGGECGLRGKGNEQRIILKLCTEALETIKQTKNQKTKTIQLSQN